MDRSLRKKLDDALSLFDRLGEDTRNSLLPPPAALDQEIAVVPSTAPVAGSSFASTVEPRSSATPTESSVRPSAQASTLPAPIPQRPEYQPALRDRQVLEALLALHQNRLPPRRATSAQAFSGKTTPRSEPHPSEVSSALDEMRIPTIEAEVKWRRPSRSAAGLSPILRAKTKP